MVSPTSMFIKELLRGDLNVHVLSIQTLKLKKFYFHIPFSMGWNVIKVKIKWFPYVTETIWGFPGPLTVGHLTDLIVGDKAKGRFSKRRQPESKACQIFRTCAYQEVRNVHFSENLACFVFCCWDSAFCIITDVMKIGKCLLYNCKRLI